MHALIVVAHPDTQSHTHAVAAEVARGVTESGSGNRAEIADLVAEGFDPRFTAADLALFRNQASAPPEIIAEQQRIDRAGALVLVYPIYWWSFPALLKGWIDRVFTNGWAYEESTAGKPDKKLRHLQVHLLAIGAADAATYARRGYDVAMKTQIDHGIFDYVGAKVVTSELLLMPDAGFPERHLEIARQLGNKIAG